MANHRDTRVLFTGAGGVAAPYLIASLRTHGYTAYAADMDAQATGLYLADRGFVIPGGSAATFLPALRKLCAEQAISAVVPLVDEELSTACALEQDGITVLLPHVAFVALCLDKYALAKRLEELGISALDTRLASDNLDSLRYPVIIKPRVGRGSRGLAFAADRSALDDALDASSYVGHELLVQECAQGDEYTVSVVAWRDGEVQAVVPKRIISKRGVTRLAVTERHAGIDAACRQVQMLLKADGPFNVQLIVDRNNGTVKIFEINPRFSTSVTLTAAAGIDEFGGLVKQALEGRAAHVFGPWRDNVVLIRRSQDDFVDWAQFSAAQGRISSAFP